MIQHQKRGNYTYLNKQLNLSISGKQICEMLQVNYYTELNTWNANNRKIETFFNFLLNAYESEMLKMGIIKYQV